MARGRPFEPGNKFGKGRPPGSRNKEKSGGEKLLEQYEEALTSKCISMALQGNTGAMNLCIPRLFPSGGKKVKFHMKKTRTAPDIKLAHEEVEQAAAGGKMTPAQGESFSRMLRNKLQILEQVDPPRIVGF